MANRCRGLCKGRSDPRSKGGLGLAGGAQLAARLAGGSLPRTQRFHPSRANATSAPMVASRNTAGTTPASADPGAGGEQSVWLHTVRSSKPHAALQHERSSYASHSRMLWARHSIAASA